MMQAQDEEVISLTQLIHKATKRRDQLQFLLDQLTFDEQETSEQRVRLMIQNQNLIQKSSQIKVKTNEISRELEELQPKYQSVLKEKQHLNSNLQKIDRQIQLFDTKRFKSRSLINDQTKRKLTLAADCQQIMEKTEKIYERIDRLKEEMRQLKMRQIKERSTTQEIQKVLDEFKMIEEKRAKGEYF